MRALFITATGTGIGKTLVTCALAWQLRRRGKLVKALKPIVTGYDPGNAAASDPHLILEALGETASCAAVELISPWRYAAPLAPDAAAAQENHRIDFDELVEFCRAAKNADGDFLLIEGIGGALVPLGRDRTVADWIAALDIPCLLVSGSYLGSLSHTISTLEAMRGRGLRISRLVISGGAGEALPLEDTATALAPFLDGMPVTLIPRLRSTGQLWQQAPEIPVLGD